MYLIQNKPSIYLFKAAALNINMHAGSVHAHISVLDVMVSSFGL